MPKSSTTASNVLKLVLQAVAWANMADNAAASPYTNVYLSLHTADPGVGNAQTTNEVAYTDYLRVAVARTSGGWDVVSNVADNTALVQFAQCGVTGATATHVAIGTNSSGAGNVLWAGALNSSLAIAQNIQPQFNAGALTVTET